MRQALQAAEAVLSGLNTTNRKKDWGLNEWPKRGVSETNPFASSKRYDFMVVFELVNKQGRVIGNQVVRLNPEFSITTDNIEFKDISSIVKFNGVRANDISDNLTIHIASVNGAPPKKVRFTITVASTSTEKPQSLVDSRDGKRYNTVRIGGKVWMAQNLDYQPQTGNSWCYQDNNSNCAQYGRLYDWNTAMDACPVGWHLPYSWEWDVLKNGDSYIYSTKLKATSDWNSKHGNGTDDFGFSALPGGGRYNDGNFHNAGDEGLWWTATKYGSGSAYIKYVDRNYSDLHEGNSDKGSGFSVRCIADN
jgi:uncharacterized protein (TIGR02145 family)